MTRSVIVSGAGGQGIMLMGKLLAHAGMIDGFNVTWFPSYGAEMRGGTANCTVVLSDELIGSPIVGRPDAIVALNCQSRDRFMTRLKNGGTMIVESAEVEPGECCLEGISCLRVPARELAAEAGEPRSANMVMLGALVRKTAMVKMASVELALDSVSEAVQSHDMNLNAFRKGMDFDAC